MTQIVLAGGGHAHVLVLRAFGLRPEPGVSLTLVAPDRQTPYSGMLPGHVAGFYRRQDMHIDLAQLAEASGAKFVQDEAQGFDRPDKSVRLRSGARVPYDVLSIDIGITPDLSGIAGAAEHALVVKPIGHFLHKWDDLLAQALRPDGPRRIAVVGGGVAGLCLAFAVATALRQGALRQGGDPKAYETSLVSPGQPRELNATAMRAAKRALGRRGIRLVGGHATAIEPGVLTLDDGRQLAADAALVATHAAPPPPLAGSGFARDEHGFLAVRPTLQVMGEDDVFAAGDCATMIDHPRPKAGIYAVRQGEPLARNLRRRARGEPLEPFVPQAEHLVLIATGDGRAIGSRGSWFAVEGRWVWWWKDRIDRRFMRQFE